MAQPAFQQSQPIETSNTDSIAGGDVGEMQAIIYERFATADAAMLAPPQDRLETAVAFASRWGGVALFVAALTAVGYAIL